MDGKSNDNGKDQDLNKPNENVKHEDDIMNWEPQYLIDALYDADSDTSIYLEDLYEEDDTPENNNGGGDMGNNNRITILEFILHHLREDGSLISRIDPEELRELLNRSLSDVQNQNKQPRQN